MTVAVVVPVYNGGAKFRASLDSIRRAVPPPDELIVVGDGDTDGSSQYAEAAGITVHRFPAPGGPGRARNLGASRAKSDILFFVDADVTVPENVIRRVKEIFAQHAEVAAVIGSYDDQPKEPNFLSQYRNLLHHYVHQNGREEASTFWGACGAIRRDVFLTMGGFDETYTKPSIEDIELGYRLKKAGYTIRLCKSLQVKHWKRWTVVSMLQADFFQRALPWTQLIHRDGGLVNDLNIGISGPRERHVDVWTSRRTGAVPLAAASLGRGRCHGADALHPQCPALPVFSGEARAPICSPNHPMALALLSL